MRLRIVNKHTKYYVLRYAAAFDLIILPIAREYAPELIIVSAGFDSARGDPLGSCDLTPKAYAQLVHHLYNPCLILELVDACV